MLINSMVADAARTLGGSAATSAGLLARWIERRVDGDAWERLGVMGLDAIALKRGHRDGVAWVTVPRAEGGVEMVAVRADRQQQTVAAFRRAIPEPRRRTLEAASHLREDLTDLVERDDTQAGATGAIRAWCKGVRQRGLAEFARCLGTLARWMEEITSDFQGRQTSGFVEGFNHRVKVLKRRCSGSFNVGSLCQRLTRDWHGYQLFGHT
jgi:hypothetical protein